MLIFVYVLLMAIWWSLAIRIYNYLHRRYSLHYDPWIMVLLLAGWLPIGVVAMLTVTIN